MANSEENEKRERGKVNPYRSSVPNLEYPRRRRLGIGWWIVLCVLAGFAIWLVGWGPWGSGRRIGENNTAYNASHAPATPAGAQVTSMPQLISNGEQLEGRQIVVPRAYVQQRLGDNALLVSPMASEQNATVVVTIPARAQMEGWEPGTQVQITGKVQKGQPKVTGTSSQNVPNGGYYLEASAISETPGPVQNQNVNR